MPPGPPTGDSAPDDRALTREWSPPYPVDVRLVLSVHRRGSRDPAYRTDASGAVWRTVLPPDGPGTLRVAGRGARIDATAWGPGAGCRVGPRAQVDGSVLFDGATVGPGAVVRSSAVGRGARIGDGAVLDGVVIGDGARIASGNELAHGLRVWPDVELGPTAIRFSTDA